MECFRSYIGDKTFYGNTMRIMLPILAQGSIYNFVELLNNLLVGQISTVQMNGVAVVNQLMFVFYSCVSGIFSGVGIFTAQFSGKNDDDGVRYTFRFKVITSFLLSGITILFFAVAGRQLVQMYLMGEGRSQDAEASLRYGIGYLRIMMVGILPYALINVYSSTLRETGQTRVPMISCVLAMVLSHLLHYVFVFGLGPVPAMGCYGAGIATLIARMVEFSGVAGWTHFNRARNRFIQGAYRSLYIPPALASKIVFKSTPYVLNQLLWSLGVATQTQYLSVRGLNVVGACNIVNVLANLIIVVANAIGNTARIVIGHMMGRSESADAIRSAYRKFIGLCFGTSLLVSLLYAVAGIFFPLIYNTTDDVRHLATMFILIRSFILPFTSYLTVVSCVLYTGGNVKLNLVFDTVFIWVICLPPIYGLVYFTKINVLLIYAFSQCTEILKTVLGILLIQKGRWIQNIVENTLTKAREASR